MIHFVGQDMGWGAHNNSTIHHVFGRLPALLLPGCHNSPTPRAPRHLDMKMSVSWREVITRRVGREYFQGKTRNTRKAGERRETFASKMLRK